MTTNNSFFEFNFEGSETLDNVGSQTALYQLTNSGNTLTLTQSQTSTDTLNGVEISENLSSVSVWSKVDDQEDDDNNSNPPNDNPLLLLVEVVRESDDDPDVNETVTYTYDNTRLVKL